MALFKGNGPLMDVSGKVGGSIFYQRRCSNQIQPKPRKGKAREPGPHTLREKVFAKLWRIMMSPQIWQIRLVWSAWAYDHPRTNRKGYTYYMTWTQAFMSFNIPRLMNGLTHLIYPPGYEPPS